MAFIYGLFDPRQPFDLHECRYVGQTLQTLAERLDGHIKEAKGSRHRRWVLNWIRSLLNDGIVPTIIPLEEIDAATLVPGDGGEDQLDHAERTWIARGRREGWQLTNLNDGGRGNRGFIPTEESRKKMSISQRRALERDPTIVLRRQAATKETRQSNPQIAEQQGAKMREWLLNHPEHPLKILDYLAANPGSLEARNASIRAAWDAMDRSPTNCECGAGPFMGAIGLMRHSLSMHAGNPKFEEPLMCDRCGSGPFRGTHGLGVHQGYCGDDTPTACPDCEEGPFVGSAGLAAHRSNKHTDGRRDPLMCECGDGPFVGVHGLMTHIGQAHVDKPLLWCECGAGPFLGAHGLSGHRRYCGVTELLPCPECNGGPFLGLDGLTSHRAKKHAEGFQVPLMCDCGAGPFKGLHGLHGHQARYCSMRPQTT